MSLETGGRQSEKKGASENFRHGDRNSDILSVQSSTTESTNVREHDSSFPISAPDSDSDTPKSATSGETSTRASSSVGIVFTIKEVYNTRTMTGKQWNHISDWSFLLNLILNGGLFGLIFLVAEKNTSLPEEKNWTIYGTLLGLLIACFEVLLTLGYCLYRIKKPLPKSRMKVHVSVVLFACVGFTVVLYLYVLAILDVLNFKRGFDMPLHAAKAFLDATLLSSLVARQKFLCEVFIDSPYRASIRKWIYEITFVILVVTSALMLIPYLIVTRNQNHVAGRWAALFTDGWCIALLCSLMYYTYRTRNVNLSFNDVRSNLRVGALAVIVIATIHVCDFYLLSPSFNMITFKAEMKASFVLVPAFLTFGYISIMAIELFGLVALVTVTGLKLEDELDSRQIFEYDWCRVGGTATGQNISLTTGSGPLPTTFAITGPQAICYTAPTDRPVSSRSRE